MLFQAHDHVSILSAKKKKKDTEWAVFLDYYNTTMVTIIILKDP